MSADLSRYSRQTLFPPIGTEGQQKLIQSRVAIVGMGALGTALANHMIRAGVGFLRLIDRDYVEESNLQRQMLYDEEDAAGHLPKAAAAAEKLRRINSSVEVEAHIADMTWRNTEELLGDVDLILDGTDNFQTRYLINDASLKLGIPWIYGGAVGSRGMAFTILPGRTACLRCLFPHPPAPGTAETCDTAGVIGPIIHVVAAHQAVEALKWLVGAEDAMERRLRYFELWHNRDLAFDVADRKNPDCPTCAHKRFEFLEPADKSIHEISLCGRESVQISPANEFRPDLDRLEALLKPLGKVERNPFLLRAEIGKHRLVLFPDGRILVQGTTDIPEARSLVAKYIGL